MMRRPFLAVCALVLVGAACSSSGSSSSSTPPTTGQPLAVFTYGTTACPPATGATPPAKFAAPPQKCITDGKDYGAVIDTNLGTMTVDLWEDAAPGTVNNFVFLSRYRWFDGTQFHRVVPNFVIQAGGLPKERENPGYALADELPGAPRPYPKGAVAMANTGSANTNGSQFFICVNCSSLPPSYSLFGQVVGGTDVIDKIAALGNGDGPPSSPVTINSLTITEK